MNRALSIVKEIALALAVLVGGIVLGQIFYMAAGDLRRPAGMDRSQDAANGAGVVIGLALLLVHIVRRVRRRRKSTST
ncbi:MAG TPA: hypothetical protein VHG29_07860 [Novosphingobium sp.]|nr:hypothetical protein [Novosphingobium sp.]